MTRLIGRWIALATIASLPGLATAQAPDRPYYGPYSVYGPGLTYTQRSDYVGPLAVRPFAPVTIGVQTSVRVPDGGTALVASYKTFREGRHEFGAPVLGKIPLAGAPFRSTSYGYSIQNTVITVRGRVIDLAAEDERILRGGR